MEKTTDNDLGINTQIDRDRVMSFSDAVFAFAATLLVLKIDIPALNGVDLDTALPNAIISLWPQYLANIITFFVIGYYWLEHHSIFSHIKRYDKILVWLNIFLLLSVAFLPFPVDLYGDHGDVPFVVAFYSASLAIVGAMNLIVWIYASNKKKLIDKDMSKKAIDQVTLKSAVAPVIFGFAVPLSFIHPVLAQFSWVFVSVGIFIIEKSFNKKS